MLIKHQLTTVARVGSDSIAYIKRFSAPLMFICYAMQITAVRKIDLLRKERPLAKIWVFAQRHFLANRFNNHARFCWFDGRRPEK